MKFGFTAFSIINQTEINLIIQIFLIYNLVILTFLEIYWGIHVFLINFVDFFQNLYLFLFLYLILIDLDMVLLGAWNIIGSLRKLRLFDVILRKLLLKILVRVKSHWPAGTQRFLSFLNLSAFLYYHLINFFFFILSVTDYCNLYLR